MSGGAGTRKDCLGGDDVSERSTLTYVSYASPRADSGDQARRRSEAAGLLCECEEVGRSELNDAVQGFCWMRAMKPTMLSFADGEG